MSTPAALYTLTAYFARYYELLPQYDTAVETYDALQIEYGEVFGSGPRHSTYQSFKAAKSRFFATQRRQKKSKPLAR